MQKAFNLNAEEKSNLITAIKNIIEKLKSFLNKLKGMSEVQALKDDISAQIKMTEIFAEEIEKSNVQSDEHNQKFSKYAPKNRFEKALTKSEWAKFQSILINPS